MVAAHDYAHCQREDLLKYEVFDYLPGHSSIYKQWIKRQPRRYNWDRLVVTAIIGVIIGFTGILMQQIFMSAVHLKWSYTAHFLQVDHGFPSTCLHNSAHLSIDKSLL